MNLPTRAVVSLFAVSALMAPAVWAEKEHKFSDWDLGKVVFGSKLTRKDTKDKVVVLEYWGVNCPPCIASLPHLAELDKKHRDSGLVIIGAECQMSTKDEMEPILEKAKVEYTIVEGAEGPVDVTGIPRIFVFGADGMMVFDGRPSDPAFEKAVEDALEEAGGSADVDQEAVASNLIEEREWTNATGGKIRAAVQAADDSKVTFLMPNGKSVEYPLEKLSEESQEAIKEALEAAKEEDADEEE
jgi:thiol-disulfide isomerase/thioredoxin